MKSVSRKESGLAVDVVQRYLDSRQSSYALVGHSERAKKSDVQPSVEGRSGGRATRWLTADLP